MLSERLGQVAAQTRQRVVEGVTPAGATRIVSLHDPDARPIAKGRLGRPVEFGYKAQIVDNEDGVILDHNVEMGNPADAPMLVPAIERIKRRTGSVPRAVTADRGYGEASVEDALRAHGVRHVVLPRKGRPNAARSRDREPARVQEDGQLANRLRRTHQLRQTRLRTRTHPHSTASTAPEHGADTASSPTTSSRSPDSPHDQRANLTTRKRFRGTARPLNHSPDVLQVEVVTGSTSPGPHVRRPRTACRRRSAGWSSCRGARRS